MQSTRYFCQIKKKKLKFWIGFRKILKYQISRKSVSLEPSPSMQTDMKKQKSHLAIMRTRLQTY
jgi:hypothetical protein